ncbi:hypothetical protein FMUND_14373 [Fusarium mundagurra]|uniref:Uncharacterized protein n=1 Tax=Fusarium mundagurra TaxID=1567541 RepID=A0A8H5XVM3_9HYPO|nr:hypothetical protein FMUND_14373 [Fusarium mundagurra]
MSSNNPTHAVKGNASSQANNSKAFIPGWKKIVVPGDDITLPIYSDSKPFEPFPVEIELFMEEILKDQDQDLQHPPPSPMHSDDEGDGLEEAANGNQCQKCLILTSGGGKVTNHYKVKKAVQKKPTIRYRNGKKLQSFQ